MNWKEKYQKWDKEPITAGFLIALWIGCSLLSVTIVCVASLIFS